MHNFTKTTTALWENGICFVYNAHEAILNNPSIINAANNPISPPSYILTSKANNKKNNRINHQTTNDRWHLAKVAMELYSKMSKLIIPSL